MDNQARQGTDRKSLLQRCDEADRRFEETTRRIAARERKERRAKSAQATFEARLRREILEWAAYARDKAKRYPLSVGDSRHGELSGWLIGAAQFDQTTRESVWAALHDREKWFTAEELAEPLKLPEP
jgi:hypothetical protein